MDFDELYKSINLTEETVLEMVDEYTLYCFYTGYDNVPLHRAINCPFRQDNLPSFSIFETQTSDRVDYYWKDSATAESGDIFKLIQKVENINRSQVIAKINQDFALGYETGVVKPREKIVSFTRPVLSDVKITIAPTPFTEAGIEFWKQYSIGLELLKRYSVDQIKWYWSFVGQDCPYWVPDPTFSYRIGGHYQIYSPYSLKVNKFRNDLPANYFFGYLQLPKNGDVLIIDKSCKDVIFCKRLGYDAVCPRSETTLLPESKMLELKSRFKKIFLMLDPDPAGKTATEMYLQKYDFLIPKFLTEGGGMKDKTDTCKAFGFDFTKNLVDSLISSE